MQRLCVICDASLTKKPGAGRWPRYCGDECRREAERRRHPPRPVDEAVRSAAAAKASLARWAKVSDEERAEAGYRAAAARWGTVEPRRRPKTCATCDCPISASNTSLPQGRARCHPCRAEFLRQNVQHGASLYSKGCRCDVCREGQRLRLNAYYHRKVREPRVTAGRPCELCGQSFNPSRVRQRQCDDCLACVDCNQPRMKGKPRCAECSQAWTSLLRAAEQPGPACKAFYGDCAICLMAFAARHPGRVTCSTQCSEELARNRRREKSHRRRIRLVDGYVERVVPQRIHERDKWRCHICRKKVSKTAVVPHPRAATIDHLIPLAALGTHEPANVATACFACNCLKGDRGGNEQLLLIG